MTLNDFFECVSVIVGIPIFIIIVIGAIFFTANVAIPFFTNLAPEKRLQKYVDKQCIAGNAIAIKIRRERSHSFYSSVDANLIYSAIEGNEFAIQALKLDEENKYGF